MIRSEDGRAVYDGWSHWRCRVVPARHRGWTVEVDRYFMDWQRHGAIVSKWTGRVRHFRSEADATEAAKLLLDKIELRFTGRPVE